jgi:OOP family OmpA-OmpF porin
MNRMMRHGAALLLLVPAACDPSPAPTVADRPGAVDTPTPAPRAALRTGPLRTSPSKTGPAAVSGDKSIMRPAIQAEAPPAPAAPLAPTMVTIPFVYDGTGLDDAARAGLDRLVHDPATAAAQAIVVRGHSDAVGSDAANLHVSLERATAVRDYLVAAGVAAPITLIALGERRPLRPSATPDGADDPAGRAANRRVEITLTPR